MHTLSFPQETKTVYPGSNFLDMGNLLRVTQINADDFKENVSTNIFVLEDQHILSQLLYHLAVDPDWTMEEVLVQTRYRANALASLFNITSSNRPGKAFYGGFYRDGCIEHWTLIDNEKAYTNVHLDSINPLVPLYSTSMMRGYKHPALRSSVKPSSPTEFAIIGIDIVELALGWWVYMNSPEWGYGTRESFLCKYVLGKAVFTQNQLSIINMLYSFFVFDEPMNNIVRTYNVSFTTVSETKLIKKLLGHIIDDMTSVRLKNMEHFMSKIKSVYREPHFNYLRGGKQRLFTQARWTWEPGVLKLMVIYLSVCNRMKYRASDVNGPISRAIRQMIKNYSAIPEPFCRDLVVALASEVFRLNTENMKIN